MRDREGKRKGRREEAVGSALCEQLKDKINVNAN